LAVVEIQKLQGGEGVTDLLKHLWGSHPIASWVLAQVSSLAANLTHAVWMIVDQPGGGQINGDSRLERRVHTSIWTRQLKRRVADINGIQFLCDANADRQVGLGFGAAMAATVDQNLRARRFAPQCNGDLLKPLDLAAVRHLERGQRAVGAQRTLWELR